MSIIKKYNIYFVLLALISLTPLKADELKEIGKYKDWQTMILIEPTGTVCFAQSSPVLQAPKSNIRDARLFVTFRPGEKIKDEISASPGYEFNKNNSVIEDMSPIPLQVSQFNIIFNDVLTVRVC